jgi:hypothetical protein
MICSVLQMSSWPHKIYILCTVCTRSESHDRSDLLSRMSRVPGNPSPAASDEDGCHLSSSAQLSAVLPSPLSLPSSPWWSSTPQSLDRALVLSCLSTNVYVLVFVKVFYHSHLPVSVSPRHLPPRRHRGRSFVRYVPTRLRTSYRRRYCRYCSRLCVSRLFRARQGSPPDFVAVFQTPSVRPSVRLAFSYFAACYLAVRGWAVGWGWFTAVATGWIAYRGALLT